MRLTTRNEKGRTQIGVIMLRIKGITNDDTIVGELSSSFVEFDLWVCWAKYLISRHSILFCWLSVHHWLPSLDTIGNSTEWGTLLEHQIVSELLPEQIPCKYHVICRNFLFTAASGSRRRHPKRLLKTINTENERLPMELLNFSYWSKRSGPWCL